MIIFSRKVFLLLLLKVSILSLIFVLFPSLYAENAEKLEYKFQYDTLSLKCTPLGKHSNTVNLLIGDNVSITITWRRKSISGRVCKWTVRGVKVTSERRGKDTYVIRHPYSRSGTTKTTARAFKDFGFSYSITTQAKNRASVVNAKEKTLYYTASENGQLKLGKLWITPNIHLRQKNSPKWSYLNSREKSAINRAKNNYARAGIGSISHSVHSVSSGQKSIGIVTVTIKRIN